MARRAAFALAIVSRRTLDDDCAFGDSAVSVGSDRPVSDSADVFEEAVENLEAVEVALKDPSEKVGETFFSPRTDRTAAVSLSAAGGSGFENNPLSDGLDLTGLAATVLLPDRNPKTLC